MSDEKRTPCSRCKGDGTVWSDCGDSTCDCGGQDFPCYRCKGTGVEPPPVLTPEALAAIPQVRELLDAAQAIVDYAADGERLWARLHRLDLAVRTLTGGTE